MEIHVPGGGGFLDALLDTNEAYEGPSDNVIPNADETKLLDALTALEQGDCEYVILQDDNKFLQTAGDARSGYTLEYNDGSDRMQFRATDKKISGTAITDAFVAYLNHDASWRTQFTWEQFKL